MDMYFESRVKNCVKSFFFNLNSTCFSYLKTHLISPVGKKLADLYLLSVSRLTEAALYLYLQKIYIYMPSVSQDLKAGLILTLNCVPYVSYLL